MPRPKKDPRFVKDEVLRIPVSEDEKKLINKAAIAAEGEFAKWARAILLKAASDSAVLEASQKRKSPKSRGKRVKDDAGAASFG